MASVRTASAGVPCAAFTTAPSGQGSPLAGARAGRFPLVVPAITKKGAFALFGHYLAAVVAPEEGSRRSVSAPFTSEQSFGVFAPYNTAVWPAQLGLAAIAPAILVFSIRGWRNGASVTFGLSCPLTIFTFGLMLPATGRVPIHLLLIPLAWSALGTMAVLSWGVLEDLALPLSAALALVMVLFHNGRVRVSAPGGARAGVGETPAPPEGIRRLH